MSNLPPPPVPTAPLDPLVQILGVTKSYRIGPVDLPVLRGVDLSIGQGEFVAIMGASGSGKSTLLHIAGALDQPDSGRVLFRGESVSDMGRWTRHHLRNESFGFVFQFYHLLPELNVLENVLLPAMVKAPWFDAILRARPGKEKALDLLTRFGLQHRLRHRPAELSGGERQRVAIARALINQPALLLADEPTGNLDSKTGRTILDVLVDLHHQGQSILLVTHDPHVAAMADRVVELDDGRLRNHSAPST
ncbi:MAG: ABC transporter ATP-binding protein [Phycisphaerae bacterium]